MKRDLLHKFGKFFCERRFPDTEEIFQMLRFSIIWIAGIIKLSSVYEKIWEKEVAQ